MGYDVDHERGVVHCEDREVWVRAYPSRSTRTP